MELGQLSKSKSHMIQTDRFVFVHHAIVLALPLLDIVQDQDTTVAWPAWHETHPEGGAVSVAGIGQHSFSLHAEIGIENQ